MKSYAIYDASNGALRWFMTSEDDHIDNSTPAGCSWIEVPSFLAGDWRVDLSTKQLVAGAVDVRLLQQAKDERMATLSGAYAAAIAQPVAFTTAAGVAQTYQGDPQSVSNAVSAMLGCQAAQAVPAGFFWLAADNSQVPFTYADLQGLAAALFQQGQAMFVKLQTLKAQVRAASTISAVDAIGW